MKMKPILLILLASYAFLSTNAQELFVDKQSQDICLFIGSISAERGERGDKLKVLENGKIVFKNPEDLIQVDLLIGNEYTDELFGQGLCFKLSGYEPYWNATIFGDTLRIWSAEDDAPRPYKMNLYTNQSSMSPKFFAMFATECGTIFGTINNTGLMPIDQCRVCEYNMVEDEETLYEVYINIRGSACKGCATVGLMEPKP